MACFHPQDMYTDGKGGYSMVERPPYTFRKILFKCGKCVGCLKDRRDEWSMRVMDEARVRGPLNCSFLTLTYDVEHIPMPPHVSKEALRLFIRRLRKAHPELKIKYFGCGEYGDKGGRPHYHLIIFGYNFPDRKFYSKNKSGDRRYKSDELERLWPFGLCEVGDVTHRSAGYCASYLVKSGGQGPLWNDGTGVDPVRLAPPFQAMSTHPGIGANYFERYGAHDFAFDFHLVEGSKRKIPRYYEKLFRRGVDDESREANRAQLEDLKVARELKSAERAHDNTPARLAVREECAKARRRRWSGGSL